MTQMPMYVLNINPPTLQSNIIKYVLFLPHLQGGMLEQREAFTQVTSQEKAREGAGMGALFLLYSSIK